MYSIDAKPEHPQTQAMMRGPMLRALLEDRFRLRIHRETRVVPVYFMTLAKGRSKLHPTQAGSCKTIEASDLSGTSRPDKPFCADLRHSTKGPVTIIDVTGITLGLFSRFLRPGCPVIDRTGLKGAFDIHLETEEAPPGAAPPAEGQASDPRGASLIAALREQLGLSLEPGRGPYEVLVVDRMEKAAEN
jgi:uncharacterized protein (TIGR03435 family)